jgi:hypothetical protein
VLDWTGGHPRQPTSTEELAPMTRSILATLAALAVCGLALAGTASGASLKLAPAVVVKVGQKRSFARTELRPGAFVKCTYHGHSLSLAAPTGKLEGSGAAWAGAQNPLGFHLNVIGKPGGAYAVTCALGGSALVI